MKSWTNWIELSQQNVSDVPDHAKGIYVIRRTRNVDANNSDIIYIGSAGTGNQGVGMRLGNLLRGLQLTDDRDASNNHSASPRIRRYLDDALQFSWVECLQAPDGIEKALLLAFWTSTGRLPVCNERF
jgi:hydroxymethylglutaryl-CoA reductase